MNKFIMDQKIVKIVKFKFLKSNLLGCNLNHFWSILLKHYIVKIAINSSKDGRNAEYEAAKCQKFYY